jgi:hypothetical protein
MVNASISRTLRLRVLSLMVWLGVVGFGLGCSQGAERIRFSYSADRTAFPDLSETNRAIEKFSRSIDNQSPRSQVEIPNVLPANQASGVAVSRQMEDAIDQQRNWIFVSPGMVMENMNDRFLGGKKNDFKSLTDTSGRGQKPKTAMERFWRSQDGSQDNTSRASRKEDSTDNREPTSNVSPTAGANPASKDAKSEMDSPHHLPNSPTAWNLPVNAAGFMPNLNGTMLGKGLDNGVSMKSIDQAIFPQQQSRDEIRQWLRPGQPNLPLTGPNDPINLFPDLTRRDLQPVTARTTGDYDKKTGSYGTTLEMGTSLLPMNSLNDLNNRSTGQSSLTPAIANSPSSSTVPSKFGDFEIPRRKF